MLERLDPGSQERGEALWAVAWVALIQGDRPVARVYLDECEKIVGSLQDRAMQGHAAHSRALLNLFEGDLDNSVRLYHRAIAMPRARAAIAETMRIGQDFRDGVCTALCIATRASPGS